MDLANKLIVVLGITLVVVLGAAGAIWVHREVALNEANAREDLLIMGRALRPALVQTWRIEGREAALALLDYVDERFRAQRKVTVRWAVLESGGGTSDEVVAAGPELDALRRGEPVSLPSDRSSGVVEVLVPVHAAGLPAGALELTRSLQGVPDLAMEHVRDGLTALAVVLLILTIATSMITRRLVGRPLAALAEQARCMGRGDLSTRLSLGQAGDVALVAAEMNETCDRLLEVRERVAAEHAARLKAIDQLRHADRLATVGKLAAGVAHELGTPLNVMVARAKMIATGDQTGEEAKSSARVIALQGARITHVVRQLLGFARRPGSPKVPCALGPLVEQTLAMLEPLAQKNGVRLKLEPAPATGMVLVEMDQLEQALTNLVVNGMQAMPAGGTVTVGIHQERLRPPLEVGEPDGEFLCVEVRDEGTGISEGNLPHVFDPFFTTKPVGEGTGLGLSVAYGIARDHGGWIDVTSDAGRGSRFAVHLPMVDPALVAANPAAFAAPPRSSPPQSPPGGPR